MKLRDCRGGVIVFVLVCTITVALIGTVFLFCIKVIGGCAELTNATDSGGLNVAKYALNGPNTTLRGADEIAYFGRYVSNGRVSILDYNNLVMQTLLVSINAQNNDNGDGKAIADANKMVNALQTGPDSIGGRLSHELSRKSGNVLFSHFDSLAQSNSTRMFTGAQSVERLDQDFSVAYLNQADSPGIQANEGATNVVVPEQLRNLFTGQLASMLITINGTTYLRGYCAPALKAGLVRVVAVPVEPGQQPHLISGKAFSQATSRSSSITHAQVPPNAFKIEGTVGGVDSVSCSTVGCPSQKELINFSLPLGYLEVVNGTATDSVPGPFGGLDTWIANEALAGTPVSGPGAKGGYPIGAKNLAELQAWGTYFYNQKNSITPNPLPSLTDIFLITSESAKFSDTSEEPALPATEADLHAWLDYDPKTGQVNISHDCSDMNVTSNDSSAIDPECQKWYLDGVFDRAFGHAGSSASSTLPPCGNLMAVECAKCSLQHLFVDTGNMSISPTGIVTLTKSSGATVFGNINCGPTGLRTYNCSQDMPCQSMGNCQVSTENDALALCDQVSTGFSDTVIAQLTQRLQEVNAKVTTASVRTAVTSQTLPLGSTYYLSVDSNANVIFSTTKPVGYSNVAADCIASAPNPHVYDIDAQVTGACGFVNPHKEGGIHDIMYRDGPLSTTLKGTDKVTLTLSSGFENLLGRLQFGNTVAGAATGFSGVN